jgi:hypothetical protein
MQAIHKAKADAQVSGGREVESLVLAGNAALLEEIKPVLGDVLAATRVHAHQLREAGDLEEGVFRVEDARFVERTDPS